MASVVESRVGCLVLGLMQVERAMCKLKALCGLRVFCAGFD